MIDSLFSGAERLPGQISVWYEDLTSGEVHAYNAEQPLIAASVIKLFIMAEAFAQFESGSLRRDEEFAVEPAAKMPSCGALTYLHDGIRVTALDLVTLMIILSDNTATNLLIDRLGIDAINRRIKQIGAEGCRLNRKLFDAEASSRGIENYITASGVAKLLRMIWKEELVSPSASREMLAILKNQRLNGKIPFFLDCPIAHKTGEDSGITHDAAIVLSDRPFLLTVFSNQTDVPACERFMQDLARDLAR